MGDFHTIAANAASNAMDNPAEALAKVLTSETPKIDSGVKSYLSLLAARGVTHTRNSSNNIVLSSSAETRRNEALAIADPVLLLKCTRALLGAINSFNVPERGASDKSSTCVQEQEQSSDLEYNVIRILWNNFVTQRQKPSKFLGRTSLLVVFPILLQELRTNVPKIPGLSDDQIINFFAVFSQLLRSYSEADETKDGEESQDDDSKLLWSTDGGADELSRRRARRKDAADKRKEYVVADDEQPPTINDEESSAIN
mmetsp:Transcript_22858/g.34307  ORF Transcript_22858/g.34307 Transcript_22858/m.34307 type:complete len:256 (-) Transcript_22858:2-769(-)